MPEINKDKLREQLDILDSLKKCRRFVKLAKEDNDPITIDITTKHYSGIFGEWSKWRRRELLDSDTLLIVIEALIEHKNKEIDKMLEEN